MNTLNSLMVTLTATVFLSGESVANEKMAEQWVTAQQCSLISERLERLHCFDQVFQTATVLERSNHTDNKPRAWHVAFETGAGDALLNVVKNGTEKEGDAWITLTSKQLERDSAPILMMSCINKISRLELALPQAIEDARIRVSVSNGPSQSWRSDDLGVLFSSAQGVPAISMMKAMSKDSRLTLRSNSPRVDGLQFDASQLSQALKPLRTRCGW